MVSTFLYLASVKCGAFICGLCGCIPSGLKELFGLNSKKIQDHQRHSNEDRIISIVGFKREILECLLSQMIVSFMHIMQPNYPKLK